MRSDQFGYQDYEAHYRSLVTLAFADGQIDLGELEALAVAKEQWGISKEIEQDAIAQVRAGKARVTLPSEPAAAQACLVNFVDVATADGEVSPHERRILDAVAQRAGVGKGLLDHLLEVHLNLYAAVKQTESVVAAAPAVGASAFVFILRNTKKGWLRVGASRDPQSSLEQVRRQTYDAVELACTWELKDAEAAHALKAIRSSVGKKRRGDGWFRSTSFYEQLIEAITGGEPAAIGEAFRRLGLSKHRKALGLN